MMMMMVVVMMMTQMGKRRTRRRSSRRSEDTLWLDDDDDDDDEDECLTALVLSASGSDSSVAIDEHTNPKSTADAVLFRLLYVCQHRLELCHVVRNYNLG